MKGYITPYDEEADALIITIPHISNIGNIQDIASDEAEVTLIGIGKPLITPE